MKEVTPNPRPIFRVLTIICVLVTASLVMGGIVLALTFRDAATTSDIVTQGRHRDCVTLISAARRAVFDDVDIYKAIQIEQLSAALLASQVGQSATPEVIEAFRTNDLKLADALSEARRLQPSSTLESLIAHGGSVAGRHYEACP